ncbi:MAG: hypothetical protein KDH96_08240, partial [Candidatus Riesia sp.]|nr:hypothetical protein [Candidatus Riesia sp.]
NVFMGDAITAPGDLSYGRAKKSLFYNFIAQENAFDRKTKKLLFGLVDEDVIVLESIYKLIDNASRSVSNPVVKNYTSFESIDDTWKQNMVASLTIAQRKIELLCKFMHIYPLIYNQNEIDWSFNYLDDIVQTNYIQNTNRRTTRRGVTGKDLYVKNLSSAEGIKYLRTFTNNQTDILNKLLSKLSSHLSSISKSVKVDPFEISTKSGNKILLSMGGPMLKLSSFKMNENKKIQDADQRKYVALIENIKKYSAADALADDFLIYNSLENDNHRLIMEKRNYRSITDIAFSNKENRYWKNKVIVPLLHSCNKFQPYNSIKGLADTLIKGLDNNENVSLFIDRKNISSVISSIISIYDSAFNIKIGESMSSVPLVMSGLYHVGNKVKSDIFYIMSQDFSTISQLVADIQIQKSADKDMFESLPFKQVLDVGRKEYDEMSEKDTYRTSKNTIAMIIRHQLFPPINPEVSMALSIPFMPILSSYTSFCSIATKIIEDLRSGMPQSKVSATDTSVEKIIKPFNSILSLLKNPMTDINFMDFIVDFYRSISGINNKNFSNSFLKSLYMNIYPRGWKHYIDKSSMNVKVLDMDIIMREQDLFTEPWLRIAQGSSDTIQRMVIGEDKKMLMPANDYIYFDLLLRNYKMFNTPLFRYCTISSLITTLLNVIIRYVVKNDINILEKDAKNAGIVLKYDGVEDLLYNS